MNIFQDKTPEIGKLGTDDARLSPHFPNVSPQSPNVFQFINPSVKLISLILFIILVFFPVLKEFSYPFILIVISHLIFLLCIMLIFYALVGIKPREVIRVLFKIKILFILTIIFRSFSFGKYYYVIPLIRLPISLEGFVRGIILFTQIFLVMLACRLFTYTTSPDAIVSAIKKILTPLKVIKIPVEKIAKIFTMTLYLTPEVLRISQEKAKNFKMNQDRNFVKGFFNLIHYAIEFLSDLLVTVLRECGQTTFINFQSPVVRDLSCPISDINVAPHMIQKKDYKIVLLLMIVIIFEFVIILYVSHWIIFFIDF